MQIIYKKCNVCICWLDYFILFMYVCMYVCMYLFIVLFIVCFVLFCFDLL